MTLAVELSGVQKRFGNHVAVDGLDLAIAAGSIYGFIGPNGSGKTTSLRMILGILDPDEGRIAVLGNEVRRSNNDRIGYLPEERGLYRKMSVRRVLTYYAALKGVSSADARSRGDAWLERLSLTDWATKKVEALSKGMQQKVQFIATVLSEPELVILDEPFSGLDPVNLEVLREAILSLKKSGTSVIFSTHDMLKAEEMCDAIGMIFKGKKVLDGTLDQIQQQYGADTVRVRARDVHAIVAAHPGVTQITDLGQLVEVQLEGDPQALLASLVAKTEVTLFELKQPSLHDIFVRIAGPAGETSHG